MADAQLSPEDGATLTEAEHERWAKAGWELRKHYPVGAYLPVGQMDGDCKACGHAWPCPPWQAFIAAEMAFKYCGRGPCWLEAGHDGPCRPQPISRDVTQ